MAIDNTILRCTGGLEDDSLCHLLNVSEVDISDPEKLEIIKHSPYYLHDLFDNLLYNSTKFKIFSSNIDLIFSKFDGITIMINCLKSKNIDYDILSFQECYIKPHHDITHIQIEGYNCVSLPGLCGRKSGLICLFQRML